MPLITQQGSIASCSDKQYQDQKIYTYIEDFDYMDADGQPIHLDHALVGIGAKGEGLQIYNFDAKYDEWISKGIEFRWGDQLKVTGN